MSNKFSLQVPTWRHLSRYFRLSGANGLLSRCAWKMFTSKNTFLSLHIIGKNNLNGLHAGRLSSWFSVEEKHPTSLNFKESSLSSTDFFARTVSKVVQYKALYIISGHILWGCSLRPFCTQHLATTKHTSQNNNNNSHCGRKIKNYSLHNIRSALNDTIA